MWISKLNYCLVSLGPAHYCIPPPPPPPSAVTPLNLRIPSISYVLVYIALIFWVLSSGHWSSMVTISKLVIRILRDIVLYDPEFSLNPFACILFGFDLSLQLSPLSFAISISRTVAWLLGLLSIYRHFDHMALTLGIEWRIEFHILVWTWSLRSLSEYEHWKPILHGHDRQFEGK